MSLHIDGFDQFLDETKLSDALLRAGYTLTGGTPTLAIGRNDTKGLACTNGAFARLHPWLSNDFAAGCAMLFADRASVMWLELGGEKLVAWASPVDGWTHLNDVAGNALPVKEYWYYYEIALDRTEGVARLYINNRLDAEIELAPAMQAATEVKVCYGAVALTEFDPDANMNLGARRHYDDIYIRDGLRYGPVVVSTRVPTAHTLVEWNYTSGTGTPSQILGTLPPEPLDRFMASDVIGSKSKFISSQNLLSGNKVVATGVLALVRKSPMMDAKLRATIGGDGQATARSRDVEVDATYQLKYLTFEEVAGDTPAGIKNTQFGIEVAAP